MKFDFEKHGIKKELKKETLEQNQETFEKEIMLEAQKLGTNIQQLKSEIDQYGGMDKFKEYFEESTHNIGINVAGAKLRDISNCSEIKNDTAKGYAIMGSVLVGLSAFLDSALLTKYGANFGNQLESIQDILSTSKDIDTAGIIMEIGLVSSIFATGITALVSSIKNGVEVRKLNRKKQKEDLKFKLTDTEVKK